jgi:hypothetical protein
MVHGLPPSTVRVLSCSYFPAISTILIRHAQSFIPSHITQLKPKHHSALLVASKLKRTKPIYVPEFEATKALVGENYIANIKITLCSPVWYDFRYGKNWVAEGSGVYESRGTDSAGLLTDEPLRPFHYSRVI